MQLFLKIPSKWKALTIAPKNYILEFAVALPASASDYLRSVRKACIDFKSTKQIICQISFYGSNFILLLITSVTSIALS